MNILIIGATGPTGKHLVHRALEAGDHVTIMARRPEAMIRCATASLSSVAMPQAG